MSSLEEKIENAINEFLRTGFATARAGFALPPCLMDYEWIGSHALDEVQYLHLSGADYRLVPKIMELIREEQD